MNALRCWILPLALGALALGVIAPRAARAGTEEFSTFDVEQQEEDDESTLDHLLTRAPRQWLPQWEHATHALRTEQGCLTSGQWFIHTDLKTTTAMGDRARFGVRLRQSEDDLAHFDYLDLVFSFPTRAGTIHAAFRPLFDKSRQDFLVAWEAGSDTSALQVVATLGFEDLFNNLWEFRQTRIGNHGEPYTRHPYEPALNIASRHDRWRVELAGKYLTPSRKSIPGLVDPDSLYFSTLWGTQVTALAMVNALGCEWEARGWNQQAFSRYSLEGTPIGPDGNYRRGWSAEAAVRRALGARLTGELRYVYVGRAQHHTLPYGPGGFGALDRVAQAELSWQATPRLTARAGGLFDRVNVANSGLAFAHLGYGTRNESRGYLGLVARFGNVSVSGVEGIELDPERYDVWLVHDKGFLQLQALF